MTLDAFGAWVLTLAGLDQSAKVLAEAGRVLAGEIDEAGNAGRSAAAAVAQLRAVMAELRQKVTADVGEDDWSAPVLATVRNIA